MKKDKIRILVSVRETAGDIFLLTGTLDSLKKKYPNSNIYVSTSPQYYEILEGNPNIKGIIGWNDSMYDYRTFAKWGPMDNIFDIAYCPSIQTQVAPHNWLNGKYACYLGRFYANACDVPLGETFIKYKDISRFNLPSKYITIQSQSSQDPKNYDHLQSVINNIQNIPKVLIGADKDKVLNNIDIDLRGKTNFGELASVIKGAAYHVGLDSICMHFAIHAKVPSFIFFGGTLPEAAIDSKDRHLVHVFEPPDRGPCVTSCHLVQCEAQKIGFDKCINNVSTYNACEKLSDIMGKDHVKEQEPIKLSAYIIIKDGVKYNFPFEKCIEYAAKVADEVIVVDGESRDGTFEKLKNLELEYTNGSHYEDSPGGQRTRVSDSKIKLFRTTWDMNNPKLMGELKQHARSLCTGNWLLQLDADEIFIEPYEGATKKIIKDNANHQVLDFPCYNLYGSANQYRVEPNVFKWRITKNDKNIVHGIHGAARVYDTEKNIIVPNKELSDGCEFIYADSLNICMHKPCFDFQLLHLHNLVQNDKSIVPDYISAIERSTQETCYVIHASWLDLERKKNNGKFWDETFVGQNQEWHNTTRDISKRIEESKDFIITIQSINNPFKV